MTTLSLDKIYKKYPNATQYAVEDFNIDIKDKEFIVFVGPSGCGKSTTLRMVAGLEDITEGEFKIDGKIMNDVAPKDRDIAMVFQNYALYPHMTVFDNMAFGLKLRKFKKDEINLDVKDGYLTISAQKGLDKDEENKKGRILRQERYAGVCSRSFYVGDVKPEEVKAKYESGVLTIALPKEDARKCSSCNTITIE